MAWRGAGGQQQQALLVVTAGGVDGGGVAAPAPATGECRRPHVARLAARAQCRAGAGRTLAGCRGQSGEEGQRRLPGRSVGVFEGRPTGRGAPGSPQARRQSARRTHYAAPMPLVRALPNQVGASALPPCDGRNPTSHGHPRVHRGRPPPPSPIK